MKFKLTEVKNKLWPINNKVIIINQNNNLTDNGNFMVSFMLNVVKFLLIYRHLQNTYWFKRGIYYSANQACVQEDSFCRQNDSL